MRDPGRGRAVQARSLRRPFPLADRPCPAKIPRACLARQISYTPGAFLHSFAGPGMTVKLPKDYRPSEDEEFMNQVMRAYFGLKLLQWKADLQRESGETLKHLQKDSLQEPDTAGRSSLETERSVERRRVGEEGVRPGKS